MVRVLVCGGRQFEDRDMLTAALDKLHQERGFTLLIAGGARGADSLAEAWAKAAGVPRKIHAPRWEYPGRRNQRMLDERQPDLVVAFPGGRGTADMVGRARSAGIEVIDLGVATQ